MKKSFFLLITSGCLLFGTISISHPPTGAYNYKEEVITDSDTGLMWHGPITKNVDADHSWTRVALACTASYGGYSGWRLPNKNELSTLIDFNQTIFAINRRFFDAMHIYWSSTTYAMNTDEAWILFPTTGDLGTISKSMGRYYGGIQAMCVRGVAESANTKRELRNNYEENEVNVPSDIAEPTEAASNPTDAS